MLTSETASRLDKSLQKAAIVFQDTSTLVSTYLNFTITLQEEYTAYPACECHAWGKAPLDSVLV